MRVLLIEDDWEIVETVSLAFQIRWPEVELLSTHQGGEGIELAGSESPDIIVLDLGLPDMNGFQVMQQIRLFSSVPILVLTVRSEEADVVRGLEWGADDYMVKPFRQLELLARVRALTRRRSPPQSNAPLTWGALNFDPCTLRLNCGEKQVKLTSTEGRILRHLMRNAGHVVPHSSLAEEIWGQDCDGAAQSLKVYIRRLREKLEPDASRPQLVLAKTGVGYMLANPVDQPRAPVSVGQVQCH
jgi:two-component system response regulator VicR